MLSPDDLVANTAAPVVVVIGFRLLFYCSDNAIVSLASLAPSQDPLRPERDANGHWHPVASRRRRCTFALRYSDNDTEDNNNGGGDC